MVDNKRKKFHDKDKYYRLAKEQGLRSRAAFKLTQINRQYAVLEKCQSAVLDLCAAPGGWTQICSRTCPKNVPIIAVDILPIRGGCGPNVTTIVGDITTDKCKAEITRALRTHNAPYVDVVLHDGAPNVGAEYGRDAYEQNELAVHALRCATQHLQKGGTFVTKIYRSRDYASYNWTLQQLFGRVQAYKPKASRAQSAEIFLIATNYKAPAKIDPRLLDPKHIFETVEGETTGGHMDESGKTAGDSAMTIFHKNWDKKVRKRGGYDHEHLDMTMRHVETVREFVQFGWKDAVQILSRSTGLSFTCEDCKSSKAEGDTEDDATKPKQCPCQFWLHHPLTTPEIKECVSDLQVLNKSDFKSLLTWRTKMQDALQARDGMRKTKKGSGTEDAEKGDCNDDDTDEEIDSEKEEEQIQSEIEEMRQRRLREKKRQKKKERAAAMKRRKMAALGTAVDFVEHDGLMLQSSDIDTGNNKNKGLPAGISGNKIFRLSTITSKKELDVAAEVNLDQVDDEDIMLADNSDDDDVIVGGEDEDDDIDSDDDDAAARLRRRERELGEAYNTYLQTTKNGLAKAGTKMAKRSKKVQSLKVQAELLEDQEMALAAPSGIGHDTCAYAKLLQGPKDSDDESSDNDGADNDKKRSSKAKRSSQEDRDDEDDDEDGYNAEPMTPEEYAEMRRQKKGSKASAGGNDDDHSNPLIHRFDADETPSAKSARWFSNPLFAKIGQAAQSAATTTTAQANDADPESASVTENEIKDSRKKSSVKDRKDNGAKRKKNEEQDNDDDDSESHRKKGRKGGEQKAVRLDPEEVLGMIPKTDKQLRHERRLKSMAREERRKARKAQRLGEDMPDEGAGFGLASAEGRGQDSSMNRNAAGMSDAQQKKVKEAQELIKAGLGRAINEDNANNGIEIVPQHDPDRPLPVMDERKYDEDYDSDDHARTLALGTMMLRRSKEKALVDASYNRFAWNDPEDLPDWFVDDENRNYRPQLPIPPALLAKMKEKMMALSTKPIAKVAEARARKNKRAKLKLAAAKKKAEAVANSADMSEASKLKAISKALRGQEGKRKPGKTYVVAKKGRGMKGAKNVKFVDKRMKSDKRAMERSQKKKGRKGKR